MTMLTKDDLSGIHAALPTPNSETGPALEPLADLVRYLIAQGVSGLSPVGGTGDYVTLTPAERAAVVEATVRAADGKVPVIAGILAPGLGDVIAAAADFTAAGADALMVITPYYVAPTQAGIVDYFRRVRDRVTLPVVLFDIPGRTGTGAQPETLATLARDGTIIGMKASGADLHHFSRTIALCGNDMAVLSGTDRLMPAHCALGGRGAIMTTASFIPAYWHQILQQVKAGRMPEALAMHRRLFPLLDVFAAEPLPVMMNAALTDIGLPMGPPRSPALPASEKSLDAARRIVAGLIEAGIVVRPAQAADQPG